MSYVVCMEQTGAEIRRRLSEPGLLKGRQRSPSFIDGIVAVGLFVARHHALADYEHIFPLARMKIQDMIKIPEWLIRRSIPILRLIGFIDLDREIVRRIHAGTKSLTPGSNPAWYCPGQYTLDPRIRLIFGRKAGVDIANFNIENQCDQDETNTLSELEELKGKGKDSPVSPFLVALSPVDEAIAEAEAIVEEAAKDRPMSDGEPRDLPEPEPWMNPRDRLWMAEQEAVERLDFQRYPQTLTDMGAIRQDVLDWLLDEWGTAGRRYSFHIFFPPGGRRGERDIRIGFHRRDMAVAFRVRWGGV